MHTHRVVDEKLGTFCDDYPLFYSLSLVRWEVLFSLPLHLNPPTPFYTFSASFAGYMCSYTFYVKPKV
jgi:hypothetical protein